MMKHYIALVAVMASLTIYAENVEMTDNGKLNASGLPQGNTPEAIAARKEYFMKKTGGFIESKGIGAPIVILDARKVPATAPSKVTEVIEKTYRFPIVSKTRPKKDDIHSFKFANEIRYADKAVMLIAIVEDGNACPALVIYPEDRVALVNVDALSAGGATLEEVEVRLIKEIWRAIGFVGGAGYAGHDKSVMQPVTSAIELDINQFQVMQPMEIQQMRKFFSKYGVKQGFRTTYKKACQEGWAPAPTNDYQKAVWDNVKAEKEAAQTNKAEKVEMPVVK